MLTAHIAKFRPALCVVLVVGVTQVGGLSRPSYADSPPDLPAAAPAAAHRAEPEVGKPPAWPFAQALSRTFGAGRSHDGADYWSDYVYDDHGAAIPGGMTTPGVSSLAPTNGTYAYSSPGARGNGADIFVSAVGVGPRNSWWRVDWNTLADPSVPLAVWTFDTDDDAATGATSWPAAAGVRSPGIDRAMVVSSRGAWLVDPVTGARTSVTTHGGALTVDREHRSFVVRVPRALLPVGGSWRVRLGAGVADATGTGLAPPATQTGLPAPGARLYNLGYRSRTQELPIVETGQTNAQAVALGELLGALPLVGSSGLGLETQTRFVTGNFWNEDAQSDALASGDVSPYSRVISWSALATGRSTPEPQPRGYSTRWYVSPLGLGQGVVRNSGSALGDLRPNYLGRIQPYSVYVPRTADLTQPRPLTWILHSLDVNHNQYAAFDPRLIQQLCEKRGSICAGTLGYGPDGWYLDEAEHDFWSVWRELAEDYRLDPSRTVISGYSMGGHATYQLGLAHPDLYAAAVTLAGPPQCGISLDGGALGFPGGPGRCTTDTQHIPLLGNARWIPWRIGHGALDQLVPITSVERIVSAFAARGLRHRYVFYPGEDHLLFAVQDKFDTVVEGLGLPVAVRNPWRIDHTWRPNLSRSDLGIGATSAYWVSQLRASSSAPGSVASVKASSSAIPHRAQSNQAFGPTPVTSPLAATVRGLGWRPGALAPRAQRVQLSTTNTAGLAIDVRRALASRPWGVIGVRNADPLLLALRELRPRQRVFVDGVLRRAGSDGRLTVRLGEGSHRLRIPR